MSYFQRAKQNKVNTIADSLNYKPKLANVADGSSLAAKSSDVTAKALNPLGSSGSGGSKIGADKIGAGLGALTSLLSNNMADVDTSGKTDYSQTSDSDVTGGVANSLMDAGTMAAQGAMLGGPAGAIVGGVVGLGKNLIQGGKKRKQLKLAKKRFQNRKRYESRQTLDALTEENVVTEDNINYIKNLNNNPSYRSFKRRGSYNV